MLSIIKNILFLFFLVLQSHCLANESDKQPLAPLVAVVNQQVKQDTISKLGLIAIFKMRLHKWKDGSTVTVYVLEDDHPLHKSFCKTILNVFPHQMRRIWNRLVFSGSGQAPIQLENKDEMIKKLSSTEGAIGYLRATDLNEDIRVLQIQSGSNN